MIQTKKYPLIQKDTALKQLLIMATDYPQCERLFAKYLPPSFTKKQTINITNINVVRYKHGKRCLIEYTLANSSGTYTLLGKIRAKGLHRSIYRINQRLYQGSFGSLSTSDWQVPEPVCMIPELNMWLQKQVSGVEFTQLLETKQTDNLAKKIANMSYALHNMALPTSKSHSPKHELEVLNHQFSVVTKKKPAWKLKIDYLYRLLTPLIDPLSKRPSTGIHRDFYPAQVMVNDKQLYLLDLDLFCIGDPCLDIGNFVAHIQEQALREQGNINAYQCIEDAMIKHYLQLREYQSGDAEAIQIYSTLSLARHVAISQRIPSRNHLTPTLLSLAIEQAQALQ